MKAPAGALDDSGRARAFTTALFSHIKRPIEEPDWSPHWKGAYHHDNHSIWPGKSEPGYRRAYHNRIRIAINALIRNTPKGARVLDLAAGQGNFSIMLAELGYRVTWNDLREDLIGYVRLKTDRTDIDYLAGNLFELPLERVGRFDAIIATEIIEHVAHPDTFLVQLARLLSPGGVIVLTSPNGRYFRNRLPRFSDCADPSRFEAMQFSPDADGHIFLLYPDEWVTLADRAGLRIVELDFFTNPLSNGHLKMNRLLPLLPGGWVDAVERLTHRLGPRLRARFHLQTLAVLAP